MIMANFKLLVTYKRDAAEILGESLFHEENSYSSYYLEWLGRKIVSENKSLNYSVYSYNEN